MQTVGHTPVRRGLGQLSDSDLLIILLEYDLIFRLSSEYLNLKHPIVAMTGADQERQGGEGGTPRTAYTPLLFPALLFDWWITLILTLTIFDNIILE